MYGLVERLDRESLARICRQAFAEMRDAGTTAVGEFHYLHHDRPDDFGFDDVVLAAAAEVGIRIVLLQTYYATGGIGRPLTGGQRRFSTQSVEDFLARTEALAAACASAPSRWAWWRTACAPCGRTTSPGCTRRRFDTACRSTSTWRSSRGKSTSVSRPTASARWRSSATRSRTPANITAIHCTHTLPADLARYVAAGGRICCCPLTEGNLGDGIPDLRAVPEAWLRLCLGSDSNLRIAPIEDMRWLEYGQRLRGELRGALPNAAGAVAPTLLAAATEGGAAALGLEAGRIAPGAWADLVAIDLTAPALRDIPPERLLDAIVFGAGNEAIAGTWVGGPGGRPAAVLASRTGYPYRRRIYPTLDAHRRHPMPGRQSTALLKSTALGTLASAHHGRPGALRAERRRPLRGGRAWRSPASPACSIRSGAARIRSGERRWAPRRRAASPPSSGSWPRIFMGDVPVALLQRRHRRLGGHRRDRGHGGRVLSTRSGIAH